MLQCVAVCLLSNLDCTLTCWCCGVLQCLAMCCSVLRCVTVCCSVFALQLELYAHVLVLQRDAVCCSVLQCVRSPTWIVRSHVGGAVCCSVLQCVAVCCSVFVL